MPKYKSKVLQRLSHTKPQKIQHSLYQILPKKYRKVDNDRILDTISPNLEEPEVKWVQQVVNSTLYYARAINLTVLLAFILIANKQSNATEATR